MRRWLLMLLTVAVLVWPIMLLAGDYQASSQGLTMPQAITALGMMTTIVVAIIKFMPNKPPQPININVTWPERIPEHHHPEYMTRPECERVHAQLGYEIRDVKGGK